MPLILVGIGPGTEMDFAAGFLAGPLKPQNTIPAHSN
jgi:hypothetical protein